MTSYDIIIWSYTIMVFKILDFRFQILYFTFLKFFDSFRIKVERSEKKSKMVREDRRPIDRTCL